MCNCATAVTKIGHNHLEYIYGLLNRQTIAAVMDLVSFHELAMIFHMLYLPMLRDKWLPSCCAIPLEDQMSSEIIGRAIEFYLHLAHQIFTKLSGDSSWIRR